MKIFKHVQIKCVSQKKKKEFLSFVQYSLRKGQINKYKFGNKNVL